jgi:hypothetical protein
MTIRINVCECGEEAVIETLGRIFGNDNVSLPRRAVGGVVELRGVSKDEALTAVSEHAEGDTELMEAIAYNGYEEGDEGYPGVVADAPLGACTVYIVTASGPRPEKAPGERFYLDEHEAKAEAERLSRENAPGIYSVHEMEMAPPREETTYVYGIDEDAAFDTTVVQDGLLYRTLTGLGDDLMSDEIEPIEPDVLQAMTEAAGASCGALAIARAVELGFLEGLEVIEDDTVNARPTRRLMTLFLEHGLVGVRAAMLDGWELYERQLWDNLPEGDHYVRNIDNKGLHKIAARWGVGIVSDVAEGLVAAKSVKLRTPDGGLTTLRGDHEVMRVNVYWVGGRLVAAAIDDRGELGSVHIAIVQEDEPERFAELVAGAGLAEAVERGRMCVEAAPPDYTRTTMGRWAWKSAWRFVQTGEAKHDELDDLLGRDATQDENDEYGELWQKAEEIIRRELGGQS